MLLKLAWHKCKLQCYNFKMLHVTTMVTTKKIAIEYTKKEMIKVEHVTTKKKVSQTYKRG